MNRTIILQVACVIIALPLYSSSTKEVLSQQPAFFTALQEGDYQKAKELHKAGVSVHALDEKGKTALYHVVDKAMIVWRQKAADIPRTIVAPPSLQQTIGRSVLTREKIFNHHRDMVDYLLQHGAKVSWKELYRSERLKGELVNEVYKKLSLHAPWATRIGSLTVTLLTIGYVGGALFGPPLLILSKAQTNAQVAIGAGGYFCVWLPGSMYLLVRVVNYFD